MLLNDCLTRGSVAESSRAFSVSSVLFGCRTVETVDTGFRFCIDPMAENGDSDVYTVVTWMVLQLMNHLILILDSLAINRDSCL